MWTARLNSLPAATCVALVRPVTCTGPVTCAVLPLPSWPKALPPQASTVPFDFSASTWKGPFAKPFIPLTSQDRLTAVDRRVRNYIPHFTPWIYEVHPDLWVAA